MKRFLFANLLVAGFVATATAQVSIYDIQYTTDPSGDSPHVGQTVTTAGIVTAVRYDGFVMQEGGGPWEGISVYTYTAGPVIGDEVTVTAVVSEYYGLTELGDISGFAVLSSGHPVTPTVVAVADAGQEQWESQLIAVENVTVTALLSYGEWAVDGTLQIDDTNDYLYFPQLGDQLDSLAGILSYSYDIFEIEPRFTNDIAGPQIAHYALGGDVVTMNETRDVLNDHWVEVLGDEIVGITATPPAGVPQVATGGLIFPALIDAHNHPSYNVLGPIPFEHLYEYREEWRSDPLYTDFSTQYYAIVDYGGTNAQRTNINKLAEVRAMAAGTATIQGPNSYGHSYDDYAHEGIGINNAHRWPPRIYHSTFPLSDSIALWQSRAAENWRRFVVHVAEGTNQVALDEFAAWQARVPLDERTTIIHGTALGAPEWAAMAAAGSHLVWSPESNIMLYGATTDVPGALAAGVNVALAPDWTESGTNDMLAEMKIARDWSDTHWGSLLTPQMLAEMVTVNAADALGMSDIRGSIQPGLRAEFMVIPGDAAAPYDALLAAEPADVMLTVISGRPGYGDAALMNQFPLLSMVEDITIAGMPKRLALAVDAFAIRNSDDLFADILGTLENAYEAALPQVCCFRGLEVNDCNLADVPDIGPLPANLSVYPNPFNPRTTIQYDLPVNARVSLRVYDLSGRLTRTLLDGDEISAGRREVVWDGRDDAGRAMSAGTYFCRLEAGSFKDTIRMTLVK
jgi:5-methylthioadenosine/S-adenosylhomocysteine deaminase